MNKKLLEIINNLKGTLLLVGCQDENLLDATLENDDIGQCYILSNISLTGKKFNITKRGKNKKVNIKKIKKQFRKKSLDTIVCNYETIKQFNRSFVPNSIYLCHETIYMYGSKEDMENAKIKYHRYTDKIETIKTKEGNLLKINVQNAKNHFLKDTIYKIKDFTSDALELITDILLN